ncbi:MAG TPA: isoprenylcysteine carboxylmethyltransferase family protein [Anaerolineales bacterium]|nr:isoprenylcysteine carboxylmethyltransferase family protein [Anaerolineales bacterium]
MNSLKTILYMGSLHGFFTFYAPFQLATWSAPLFDWGIVRYLAIPLWMLGASIILRCCMDIVRRGGGTPAHTDPPKQLISTGLYHQVRNPIYFGALLALVGHIIWSGSGWVIVYFLCYAIAFHILIVVFEEPILRTKFGAVYEEYLNQVPRWLPHWK